MKLPADSIIAMAIPIGMLLFGVTIFGIRLFRTRRTEQDDPELLLLGAVSQSLNERGELAATLGQLRTVHEKLVDALPFGLLWVDQKHQVAALNSMGRELLGVKPGVVGLDASFVLEPFPWLLEGLHRDPGPGWRCEGPNAQGALKRWRLRRIAAPDQVGALLSFEDITEQEAEDRRRQLRERFAELGEMTAGVAHQLKNGLAVLKGHGQLLYRAGHIDVSKDLLDEVDELDRVIQKFLQWAKPLEPDYSETKLEEVVLSVISEIEKRPLSHGRTLKLEGQGRAIADSMLLQQALLNLLENACQATPRGGEIIVVVEDGRIQILDQGPGMDEQTLLQMLRPFESGRPDGTGLGLPLALKWINAQGADLRFEMREEGGTRAEIWW
jgi:signal transduction histidine kinase